MGDVRQHGVLAHPYDVAAIPLTDGVTETALRLLVWARVARSDPSPAAADAFADKGFHATTTRDIAGRAGLSPAGVYVHFASKEDLLFSICERGHAAARDMLVASVASSQNPSDALAAILVNFSRWHAEAYRVGRIVQYEFGHLTPAHREIVMDLRRQIDAVVRSVLADGVARGAAYRPGPDVALH